MIQWTPKGLDFDGEDDWIDVQSSRRLCMRTTITCCPLCRWWYYLAEMIDHLFTWARLWWRVAVRWVRGIE